MTTDSGRRVRVNSLLMELTADFLRGEANVNPMITVTNITTSNDLKKATIFVSVFPEDREDDALVFLKRKGSDLRSVVKKKTSLKNIPFFEFAIDHGEKNRQRIDEIANQ